MTKNSSPQGPRRALRASVVAVGTALTTLASPAVAAPPETWENSDNGPLLNDLLFLIGVPLAVIAVVALLTYLPSLVRGQSQSTELAFQDRTEWFGGPREGVDAATGAPGGTEGTQETTGKGGASAQW